MPRERDPVTIVQDAEWAPGPVWTSAENIALLPGFDPPTVQGSQSLCLLRYLGPGERARGGGRGLFDVSTGKRLQCINMNKVKVKVHTCRGTEALYRPYGP